MTKYSVSIGGLSPEDNAKVNEAANSGKSVTIKSEQTSTDDKGNVTHVTQTVHQHGEHNYNFDKPVSGMHIGEVIHE